MKSRTRGRSSTTLLAAMTLMAMPAMPAGAGGNGVVISCIGVGMDVAAMEQQSDLDDGKKTKKDDAGLYFPGVGPSRAFAWALDSGLNGCTVLADVDNFALFPPAFGAHLTASGYGVGWCGSTSGASGKGRIDIANGPKGGTGFDIGNIWWESVSTFAYFNYKHSLSTLKPNAGPGNGSGIATFSVLGPGGGSCLDDKKDGPNNGATSFVIDLVMVMK